MRIGQSIALRHTIVQILKPYQMAQLPVPPVLLLQPPGAYGISYDIGTHALEDAVPNGWYCSRCTHILLMNQKPISNPVI